MSVCTLLEVCMQRTSDALAMSLTAFSFYLETVRLALIEKLLQSEMRTFFIE